MAPRAVLVAALALGLTPARGRPLSEAPEGQDVLNVQTYDWRPGAVGGLGADFAAEVLGATPAMWVVSHRYHAEPPAPDPAAKDGVVSKPVTASADLASWRGRKLDDDPTKLLQAVWDRPQYRNEFFDLVKMDGEHSCFAGFQHMVRKTDRCGGWVRQYPTIGSSMSFLNTGLYAHSQFMLKAVVAGHINVWLEEGSTAQHEDISIKAANIYTNQYGIEELRPAPGSDSWMDHECKIMGPMPFMYTCSNRINILVQECQQENAWVMQRDFLQNYPGPATNTSESNHDIIFYMCQEFLDRNPNPYAAATVFAHELAHVIQGGFGQSFNTMTEGGATWLEGPLMNLPPRPIVFAWGFRDWNRLLAAHIYANTKELNARKFYQIHGMFLAYLSQPQLLGAQATSALQNYETFDEANIPFGRSSFDYFLKHVGVGRPSSFIPEMLDVHGMHYPFADALLNYRVAMVAQCILEADLRPSGPEYQMPDSVRDQPYWDCSSFPTYWSAAQTSVESASADLHYGGAAVWRLMLPHSPRFAVPADADPRVRTKVLAAGVAGGVLAEVRELRPGDSVSFDGAREVYVVQMNADPEGEMLSPDDRPKLWHRTSKKCSPQCNVQAWFAGSLDGYPYPPNQRSALQTPPIQLPEAAEALQLTYEAMWNMEAEDADGSEVGPACRKRGWDGVQVRAIIGDGADAVVVLAPEEGYIGNGSLGGALAVFREVYPKTANCSDLVGYAGSSGPNSSWVQQHVSLRHFAGRTVRLEWLFASDGSGSAEGFWLANVVVRQGQRTLFEATPLLREQVYTSAPLAGARGKYDGVPVVASTPVGYEADRALEKVLQTRSAPWSAAWSAAAASGEGARRRAYLGWSYEAPTTETKTARLHPSQEACVLHLAPFRGELRVATLFTLVDKIGVNAVSLSLRSPSAPYALLGGRPRISASHGVHDPGMHRFLLTGWGPLFSEGEAFLMCVGIAEVTPLPADDPNSLPFLHVPLTNVSTAGEGGAAGATVLLQGPPPAPHGGEEPSDADFVSGLDPWAGHSVVLRAEFVQRPAPELPPAAAAPVAAPAGGGFLGRGGQ